MTKDEARKLAEDHWEWLQSVLDQQRQMERKLFIDAFLHGYGHRQKEENGKACEDDKRAEEK